MGENSKIEWCHHTFNIVWGCTKVSPACTHCYAETWAKRTGFDVWGADKPRRTFGEKHWQEPLKWNAAAEKEGQRKRVFCSSMADWAEDHPTVEEERQKLFPLIEATRWLDWLMLTKRIERVMDIVPASWREKWPDNAWPMTTVENQETANRRIPELIKVPAKVRGLSMEPLLGQVVLEPFITDPMPQAFKTLSRYYGPNGFDESGSQQEKRRIVNTNIAWVIAGGESGPHARSTHPDWFRFLRDQCVAAGIAFHFKQWGNWAPFYDRDVDDPDWRNCPKAPPPKERYINLEGGHGFHGERVIAIRNVGKEKAGRLLDGRTWDEYPEVN